MKDRVMAMKSLARQAFGWLSWAVVFAGTFVIMVCVAMPFYVLMGLLGIGSTAGGTIDAMEKADDKHNADPYMRGYF